MIDFSIFDDGRPKWQSFWASLRQQGFLLTDWDKNEHRSVLIPLEIFKENPTAFAKPILICEFFPPQEVIEKYEIEEIVLLTQGIDAIAFHLRKYLSFQRKSANWDLWRAALPHLDRIVIGFYQSGIVHFWGGIEFSEGSPDLQKLLYGHREEQFWQNSEFVKKLKQGSVFHNPNALLFLDDSSPQCVRYWVYPHENGGVVQIEKIVEETKELPVVDSLTQLPCRNDFYYQLQQKIRFCKKEHKAFRLYHIDLSDLKTVNLDFGFDVGDQVISTVAQRLTEIAPEVLWFRVAGATFYGISAGMQKLSSLEQDLNCPMFLREQLVEISCQSYSCNYPEAGLSAQQLLLNLDTCFDPLNFSA